MTIDVSLSLSAQRVIRILAITKKMFFVSGAREVKNGATKMLRTILISLGIWGAFNLIVRTHLCYYVTRLRLFWEPRFVGVAQSD